MLLRARRTAAIASTVALSLQMACYTYRPVTQPLATAGQRLRVNLSSEGTTELAKYLGPRVEQVEGTLVSVQPDGTMSVAVEWVQTPGGVRQPWMGEGGVAIPAAYIQSVQQHTLNRTGSVLAALGITGGLVALAVVALNSAGSQGGGDGPGTPPP